MDERLGYKFDRKHASDDQATFNLYMNKVITLAQAVKAIEKHNGKPMTEEQFLFYVETLGYKRLGE